MAPPAAPSDDNTISIAATETTAAAPSAPAAAPSPAPAPDPESGATGDSQPENDAALRGFRLYAVAVGVCFGALMMSLDISVIGTALPSILSEFGDTTRIAWYPAAFTLATCALTPVAGKMAAVFPLDLVYSAFTFIFLTGSILCGWAPTAGAFIAGRAVAGVGAAGVASNGLTILVSIAPVRKKPLFMGLGAACFGLGLVIAPIIGGVFTASVTWRWCFWINIPFNLVTLAVVSFFFRPAQGRRGEGGVASRVRSLDLPGCLIFVPAIFMLLLAVQSGGEDGWDSATVIGLFVGGGATMLMFAAWEWRRGDAAMIPRAVMRRTVVFTCLFAFSHMGALTIASYYLPAWFQSVQGVSALDSGVRMLPTVITQIISTMFASALAIRIRYYNPWFFLAPVFMCTSSVLYSTFAAFSTPPSHWIGYQVIQGLGAGFGMQMSSLAVQLELKDKPELVPVGIALVILVQYLGATILQVAAGAVFSAELGSRLAQVGDNGLKSSQVDMLLGAGIAHVRDVASKFFPQLLDDILEAYNAAITRVFFVPTAAAVVGFCFAFGIKWNVIEGAKGGETTRLRAAKDKKTSESTRGAEEKDSGISALQATSRAGKAVGQSKEE